MFWKRIASFVIDPPATKYIVRLNVQHLAGARASVNAFDMSALMTSRFLLVTMLQNMHSASEASEWAFCTFVCMF